LGDGRGQLDIGHVAGQGLYLRRVAAQAGGHGLDFGLVLVDQNHVQSGARALGIAGNALGDGTANAAGGAGDDGSHGYSPVGCWAWNG
jgi:hypothetical protein